MISQIAGARDGDVSGHSESETEVAPGSSEDEQLTMALENYVSMRRAGRPLGRDEFLARHVSIAGALADCLDGLELVENAVDHFAGAEAGEIADHPDSPPAQLGEYRIIREVGHGGMGVVFEAEQVPLGRRVALKILPSTASLDPRQRQRFQIEAQAAALLHHEHIVPIFGVGVDAGVHYYAMQFIDGRSLTQVINELKNSERKHQASHAGEPLPDGGSTENSELRNGSRSSVSRLRSRQHCQAAAQWALEAALALQHAHEIGVIHRDVKPSNLLIDLRGHLWITDFGLARLPQENNDLTRTGDVIGTLRYMSPEQLSGERGVADARTDIYALGVTLFELLTLRPAFDGGDRQQLLRRILDDEPVPPRRLNSAIPRDLETIVLKAMEKEPAARYGSASDLAGDLKRFLANEPVHARRPSLIHRIVKWAHRHRAVVVTGTTVLFLTLAASTGILWDAKRRTDATLLALQNSRTEERTAIEHALGAFDQITAPWVDAHSAAPATALTADAKRTLSFALMFSRHVEKVLTPQELMLEEFAKASRQSGRSRLLLGNAKGYDDFRHAIRAYEAQVARSPTWIWLKVGLINTLREYSSFAQAQHSNESTAAFRRALEVAVTLIGDSEAAQPCFSHQLTEPFSDLAWKLASKPSGATADVDLAVRIARQAVDWDAEQPDSWRALGLAQYRANDAKAANEAITKSTSLSGGTPVDWFLMAAIEHQLGNKDRARASYDRACAAMKSPSSIDGVDVLKLREARELAARALGLSAAESA